MTLYHGSTVIVQSPYILIENTLLDFGAGFYTTSSLQQTKRWSKIKMRREAASTGFVSVYELDLNALQEKAAILRFEKPDLRWLQFVTNNRRGKQTGLSADLCIGPVADDTIYISIRLFETGVLSAEETIARLKTEKLHDQWAFRSEKALSFLKFCKSIPVKQECSK